ncbi:nucleotidyltransferase domain-containing protein [Candidatus Parcubacteria bacterium]|nr:nucleotidyltransferase domain-containing protein [Candidatus Parcubacteria bacterium]
MTNLVREQKWKIGEIEKKFNLKLILLHGSFASGKNKFGSDLDIAVLGKKPIEFEKLLKIHDHPTASYSLIFVNKF